MFKKILIFTLKALLVFVGIIFLLYGIFRTADNFKRLVEPINSRIIYGQTQYISDVLNSPETIQLNPNDKKQYLDGTELIRDQLLKKYQKAKIYRIVEIISLDCLWLMVLGFPCFAFRHIQRSHWKGWIKVVSILVLLLFNVSST